ncbi:peptide-N4-N-acetyl-beta-glucosaminylasparagine amidase A-like protein isoform X2 [Cinnamomum micranthum f. kanehirae]|uniref:Peptide-N4-N-acetyl-beta-glucosaminylasparagine amidase A-like protein isoform X2 n=1 Tax=Cinnamomum micranthum f. kanehirae TaxID=337451 RepID=A0A443P6S6_9MAGN|nr:peptide-N4-N-acetyl-beta-glucosaminylasparagine amidase A-like protein isoform X2 [Cinnamomum micranthum f. kanehirae]
MAAFPLSFLLSFLILQNPLFSTANPHKPHLTVSENLSQQHPISEPPLTYFEVTKPIKHPKTKPCSSLILQHDFGYTYKKPPVTAPYNPPSNCPSHSFSKIILEWRATCKGRQFDRIFGIWVGGVEILRSCTAEPTSSGIVWTVEKDITRYSSLLRHPQTVTVYLGNLVDKTYTGIYHVNLTFHFYPAQETHHVSRSNLGSGFGLPADLILPISRNPPLNDGLWFLIENSTDVEVKEFEVPRNTYRAVLEVYVSFHSDDEFWYTNPPNQYLVANNLTDTPGNGAFREVVVSLDGKVVGAVWPFTVIYTGGVNPLLWRPITGIGSFDLPSYDIEITPFLGKILDGKRHKFGFGVTDALDEWFVDANLHLWLDFESKKTKGKLIKYKASPCKHSLLSKFKGLDGSFLTLASRSISSVGWVKSSHGKVFSHSIQRFDYMNSMTFEKNGNLQVVNQTINSNRDIYVILSSSDVFSTQVFQRFFIYLNTNTVDEVEDNYTSLANLKLGFNEDKFSGGWFGFSFSSLQNSQDGQGYMLVKGHIVRSGLGSTQQVYIYDSTDGCYFRNVSSSNYTILHDESRGLCSREPQFELAFGLGGRLPLVPRRIALASDVYKERVRIS